MIRIKPGVESRTECAMIRVLLAGASSHAAMNGDAHSHGWKRSGVEFEYLPADDVAHTKNFSHDEYQALLAIQTEEHAHHAKGLDLLEEEGHIDAASGRAHDHSAEQRLVHRFHHGSTEHGRLHRFLGSARRIGKRRRTVECSTDSGVDGNHHVFYLCDGFSLGLRVGSRHDRGCSLDSDRIVRKKCSTSGFAMGIGIRCGPSGLRFLHGPLSRCS